MQANAATTWASRRFGRTVGILALLALALRLVRLGHQSIWIDEGLTIGWIAGIDERGFGALAHNIHGPLHALTVWMASRVSTSEFWLRLPSAVAGALAVPALAWLGRRFWGAGVGLTAAALLVVSPFALYYSQECRNYSFTIAFACLTFATAWGFVQRPGLRRAAVFVGSELLGVLSNLNGVFLALGLNVWIVWALRRRKRMLASWAALHVVVAALFLPYAVHIQRQVRVERMVGVETDFGQAERLRGATTLHPLSLPYAAFAFAAGYSLGATLEELRRQPLAAVRPAHLPALLLVVVGFGVPLVLGLLRRRPSQPLAPLLVAAVVVCGITLWLAATNMKPFNVRYLSVLLPAFLLLVARGLWLAPLPLRAVVATAVLVVSLWSCANYLFVPRYGRDDTRGVVEHLRRTARANDLVLHINLILPLRYYDRLEARVSSARAGSGASAAAATEYVRELAETGVPTIWYLECRPEGPDPQRHLRRALEGAAASVQTQDFVGIRLYRFQMAS